MKKAEKKTRVNKIAVAFSEYKATAKEFFNALRTRKSVEHSRTPATVKNDSKTLPTSILITELTAIVRTAIKLDKLVVLGINGDNLVVLLEDKIPSVPFSLTY